MNLTDAKNSVRWLFKYIAFAVITVFALKSLPIGRDHPAHLPRGTPLRLQHHTIGNIQ